MTKRPNFESFTSGADFKQWYWLKEKLVHFCKEGNISYAGSKAEITERLAFAIDNPSLKLEKSKKPVKKSKFNWAQENLSLETIITDSYTNGPNTRKFFKQHIGASFSFNIRFMQWMKQNEGKTLKEAVQAYLSIKEEMKTKESDIPSSNQYNKYTRDFFKDNPGKTIAEARHYWKLKKSLPGKPIYERSDLSLS